MKLRTDDPAWRKTVLVHLGAYAVAGLGFGVAFGLFGEAADRAPHALASFPSDPSILVAWKEEARQTLRHVGSVFGLLGMVGAGFWLRGVGSRVPLLLPGGFLLFCALFWAYAGQARRQPGRTTAPYHAANGERLVVHHGIDQSVHLCRHRGEHWSRTDWEIVVSGRLPATAAAALFFVPEGAPWAPLRRTPDGLLIAVGDASLAMYGFDLEQGEVLLASDLRELSPFLLLGPSERGSRGAAQDAVERLFEDGAEAEGVPTREQVTAGLESDNPWVRDVSGRFLDALIARQVGEEVMQRLAKQLWTSAHLRPVSMPRPRDLYHLRMGGPSERPSPRATRSTPVSPVYGADLIGVPGVNLTVVTLLGWADPEWFGMVAARYEWERRKALRNAHVDPGTEPLSHEARAETAAVEEEFRDVLTLGSMRTLRQPTSLEEQRRRIDELLEGLRAR